jgi:hypothetical protein
MRKSILIVGVAAVAVLASGRTANATCPTCGTVTSSYIDVNGGNPQNSTGIFASSTGNVMTIQALGTSTGTVIYGDTTGSGIGVSGYSASGYGVKGENASGSFGVYGTASGSTGDGVHGYCNNSWSAVAGLQDGTGYAGYFKSPGTGTAGTSAAVYGDASGSSGTGVLGTGFGYGVYGSSSPSTGGYGVYGNGLTWIRGVSLCLKTCR